MQQDIAYAILTSSIVLVCLHLANVTFDAGSRHYVTRKISHLGGAMAYLLFALLYDSWVWPVAISAGFVVLLLGARLIRPQTFRGTGGTGRQNALSEIWYPLAGTVVLIVGWGVYDKALVAATCNLFLGIGDACTGLTRSRFYTKPTKGWQGSVAMFVACSAIAWCFIHPAWLGIAAASAATMTEWACGDVGIIKKLDDNLAISLVSLAVCLGGLSAIGGL